MSSNAAIADLATSERLRRKNTPRRPPANHYVRPRDEPSYLPPRRLPPTVEDVECVFCGHAGDSDHPLTVDRRNTIAVVLCESCVAVLDEELADDEDDSDDLPT